MSFFKASWSNVGKILSVRSALFLQVWPLYDG